MTAKELQSERQGTQGGVFIMGLIAMVSCAITDGGEGFYLVVGTFTIMNFLSFVIGIWKGYDSK